MKNVALRRYALITCMAAGVLAGCGGSHPPIGLVGAMPQSRAITPHKGVINRASSNDELLYLTTSKTILILTYPEGEQIASIPSPVHLPYVCADPNTGNVFVVGVNVTEYAHGGTTPISTLTAPRGFALLGCAINPSTGDLAVAVQSDPDRMGGVLVFPQAQGTPMAYLDSAVELAYSPTYDPHGNLFLAALNFSGRFLLTMIPSGESTFRDLTLDRDPGFGYKIQWDKNNLVIPAFGLGGNGEVYRVSVVGSHVKIRSQTKLNKSTWDTPHSGLRVMRS